MPRPNILYIMADDHTSQAWGCYNSRLAPYINTPSIDSIAEDGALLENCFCTNSICVPSRATILTGQHSHVNDVRTLRDELDPERDHVAKRLQNAGYSTAILGKWHLRTEPRGFDYFNVLHNQGRYHNPILWEKGEDWDGEGTEYEGHSTDIITDETLKWLKSQEESDDPFFCMCHFKATHGPFYSHERYRELYDNVEFPEPEDLLWEESPRDKVFDGWPLEIHKQRCLDNPDHNPPPKLDVEGMNDEDARRATYQKMVHDYMRTVAGIDDNIGRLLHYLREAGLDEDTVVIYTSDQGYFLGEHNLFDKRFMLEESLRMPFIVRYPEEIEPGTVVDDIITNLDFAELFLDYASEDVPDAMQGRSFRPNLRGETPDDWRTSTYYHYWTPYAPERPSHYGVRTKDRKLIYYYGLVRDDGRQPENCWEFYDLASDPHERQNRYDDPEYGREVANLKEELLRLRQRYGDTADPVEVYPAREGE